MRTAITPRRDARGFTLVEILIVVVLLAILATIVIPQFSSATEGSRESKTQMDLYRIRQQLELYKEHHGEYPDDADFADQLTLATDAQGNTAAVGTPGYPFGPYLRDIPYNPWTGGNDIGNGAPGSSSWYYSDGQFLANDDAAHRAW